MLREAVHDLPDEATAFTPAPNTNSLTVLTIHSLTSIAFFLGNGAGHPKTMEAYRAEDRTPAFAAHGEPSARLIARIDAAIPELEALLNNGSQADLDREVAWPADVSGLPATGLGCLFHGVAHLREHVGQAQLMRDLWFARSA